MNLDDIGGDIELQKVSTPEWRVQHVWVRMLAGDEADDAQAALSAGTESEALARLAILCMCDEDGKRLFADQAARDKGVARVLKGPLAPMRRCAHAAVELNHLTDDHLEATKETFKKKATNSSGTG